MKNDAKCTFNNLYAKKLWRKKKFFVGILSADDEQKQDLDPDLYSTVPTKM